ncbi:MAG: energy transducer TonB [candidate division Zixibacteria bacterium]|nr:energy transducer TonB [candidate division Zixibacteria bacterium]
MADNTNSALYSSYGAYALKAKYQQSFIIGTGSMLGFVLLILLIGWVISIMGEEDYLDAPAVVIKTVADLGPPPSISKPKPQIELAQPNVAAPKVGIPKPVADDEVLDEDVVIATRDELAEIVAPDISSSSDAGDIVVDIADDDYLPAPDEFIKVEHIPEMIHSIDPKYPRLAEQAGITGVVWVKALVDESGSVLKAIVGKTSGTTSLDEAAVEAAYKYKYKPAIQNGRPIKCWVTYKVDFVL